MMFAFTNDAASLIAIVHMIGLVVIVTNPER